MSKKRYLFFAVLVWVCLSYPQNLMGEEAKIKDILIESTARHMSVYARVVDCFTKDMDSAIMAGVPTTFTFYLDVYQRRSYWFDKKITNTVIQHTIKYDQVKKIYLVSSDRTKQTTGFQDYNAAKEAMSDLSGVDVIPITDLTKNRTYYLRMKAKLKKVQLPLHMEYIFFFVSVWDFETDWYVKEFGLK